MSSPNDVCTHTIHAMILGITDGYKRDAENGEIRMYWVPISWHGMEGWSYM